MANVGGGAGADCVPWIARGGRRRCGRRSRRGYGPRTSRGPRGSRVRRARAGGRGAGARTGAGARRRRGPGTSRRTSRGLEARRHGRARASHPRDAHASRRRDRTGASCEWGGTARVIGTAPRGWISRDDARRGSRGGRGRSPTHHVPFSSSRVTHFRRNDGMSPRGGPTPSSPGVARDDVPRGCEQFSGRVRCDATGGENNAPAGQQATRGAACERTLRVRAHPASSHNPPFLRAPSQERRGFPIPPRSSVRSGDRPPRPTRRPILRPRPYLPKRQISRPRPGRPSPRPRPACRSPRTLPFPSPPRIVVIVQAEHQDLQRVEEERGSPELMRSCVMKNFCARTTPAPTSTP